MALRTSVSSGLTSRRRSASVFDGAIYSSGTTSPVSGRVCVVSAEVSQLQHLFVSDPGVSQGFHDCPGPERLVFGPLDIDVLTGVAALHAHPARSALVARASVGGDLDTAELGAVHAELSPTVASDAATSSLSSWSRCCSTLVTRSGSNGARVRVRWCMRARRCRLCFMLPRTSSSRIGQRKTQGAQDGSSTAQCAMSR